MKVIELYAGDPDIIWASWNQKLKALLIFAAVNKSSE